MYTGGLTQCEEQEPDVLGRESRANLASAGADAGAPAVPDRPLNIDYQGHMGGGLSQWGTRTHMVWLTCEGGDSSPNKKLEVFVSSQP